MNARLHEIDVKLTQEVHNDIPSGHCFCLFDKPTTAVAVGKVFGKNQYLDVEELKSQTRLFDVEMYQNMCNNPELANYH